MMIYRLLHICSNYNYKNDLEPSSAKLAIVTLPNWPG